MNEKDFLRNLDLIKKIDPGNAWLPALMRGYSVVNKIYIQKALDELDLGLMIDQQKKSIEEKEEVANHNDPNLKKLHIKQSKLFTARNILSNKFHICNSNRERAGVSNRIWAIQNDIATLMKEIEYYKKTGDIIEKTDSKYDLPEDPFLLDKKIRSLRSSISRKLRQIEQMKKETPVRPDRIKEEESTLRELQIKKAYAEKRLDRIY